MSKVEAQIQPVGKNYELALFRADAKVIFGDENSLSFMPCARYSAFGEDGSGLVLRTPTSKAVSPVLTDGVIGWDDPVNNIGVRFYEHADKGRWDSALEHEVILYAKPVSADVPFALDVADLDLLYQPELTPFELQRGNTRPIEMQGGFCAYHKVKGGIHTIAGDGVRYKTGKAFDIPRPTAKDAKGNWIWGEWILDEKLSLITARFDPAWLDAAAYPVIIGPTIGYTSVGASTDNTDGFALAVVYQAASAGDANPGTAFYGGFSSSGTMSVYVGAYAYNASGPFSQSRLGVSSTITLTTGTGAFRSAAITWTGIAASTNYIVSGWSNTVGVNTYYDATGATGWFNETVAASPTNPFETAFPGQNGSFNNRASVYVDFTASGGGFTAVNRRSLGQRVGSRSS